MFECCICLHIMVMITCLIDSFVNCFVYLCLCALSPFCCTCLFVLLCIVGSLVCTIFSLYLCIEIFLALNLVDIYLVVWFSAVGLFSCRCLVDLPGGKTLLLTNQQHQLLKGLDYHLGHLKTPMRIGSDFRLTHTSTQTFLTSQLL